MTVGPEEKLEGAGGRSGHHELPEDGALNTRNPYSKPAAGRDASNGDEVHAEDVGMARGDERQRGGVAGTAVEADAGDGRLGPAKITFSVSWTLMAAARS